MYLNSLITEETLDKLLPFKLLPVGQRGVLLDVLVHGGGAVLLRAHHPCRGGAKVAQHEVTLLRL